MNVQVQVVESLPDPEPARHGHSAGASPGYPERVNIHGGVAVLFQAHAVSLPAGGACRARAPAARGTTTPGRRATAPATASSTTAGPPSPGSRGPPAEPELPGLGGGSSQL